MDAPDQIHAHPQSRDCHETQTAHPGSSINRITIRLDANAVAIIALIISVAAIVIVISQSFYFPQLIDGKIAAGGAQIQSAVQQQIADAKAVAHTAETHSRVALDRVETAEVELGKRGIRIRTDGH